MVDGEKHFTADMMQAYIKAIESSLPNDMAIFLIVAPFSQVSISNYVSNCDRASAIKMLRECADRLENNQTKQRVPFKGE